MQDAAFAGWSLVVFVSCCRGYGAAAFFDRGAEWDDWHES